MILRVLLAVIGLASVAYGLWLAYPPAAFLVAGGLVLAGALLWSGDR